MEKHLITKSRIMFETSKSSSVYSDEIKHTDCDTLDRKSEISIIKNIKKNKNKSIYINQLVKAHLHLVTTIANYYQKKYYETIKLELSDLIQEGNIGLIKSVNNIIDGKYNHNKGKFSSYCYHHIRSSITTYISNMKNNITFVEYEDNIAFEEEDKITIEDLSNFLDRCSNISYDCEAYGYHLTKREIDVIKLSYGLVLDTSEYIHTLKYYTNINKAILKTMLKYCATIPMTLENISEMYNLNTEFVRKMLKTSKEKLKNVANRYIDSI